MKSERRHELKENDLAHLLGGFSEYLRENGARLGLAVTGVLVVVAVVGITVRSRAAALEDAWQNKLSLSFENLEDGRRSLDTLSSLTETTGDRKFVLGALIDQGRYALELSQKTENPPDSEFNDKARAAFDDLLSGFPENPMAFGTANCGLATVEENAFSLDGDLGHKLRAREHLQAIILIEAPRLLFPFARNIVSDATREGGFPPLLIQPVDFVTLYQQHIEAEGGQPTSA